jgi:hypothetical protein
VTTNEQVPKWTSTNIVPPGAQALQDLATKAVGDEEADAVAYRLYEQIRQEVAHVSGLEETSRELYACQALLRCLRQFASSRLEHEDETARSVYATIGRFNLGNMFRPGGSTDNYLIPYELIDNANPESPG